MLVADSLQREELGAKGKESKVAVVAEDDPLVPVLELATKGIAEEMEFDSATVTVMGIVDALILGTPPNCRVQVRAWRALPAAS